MAYIIPIAKSIWNGIAWWAWFLAAEKWINKMLWTPEWENSENTGAWSTLPEQNSSGLATAWWVVWWTTAAYGVNKMLNPKSKWQLTKEKRRRRVLEKYKSLSNTDKKKLNKFLWLIGKHPIGKIIWTVGGIGAIWTMLYNWKQEDEKLNTQNTTGGRSKLPEENSIDITDDGSGLNISWSTSNQGGKSKWKEDFESTNDFSYHIETNKLPEWKLPYQVVSEKLWMNWNEVRDQLDAIVAEVLREEAWIDINDYWPKRSASRNILIANIITQLEKNNPNEFKQLQLALNEVKP